MKLISHSHALTPYPNHKMQSIPSKYTIIEIRYKSDISAKLLFLFFTFRWAEFSSKTSLHLRWRGHGPHLQLATGRSFVNVAAIEGVGEAKTGLRRLGFGGVAVLAQRSRDGERSSHGEVWWAQLGSSPFLFLLFCFWIFWRGVVVSRKFVPDTKCSMFL
jgi:hypothetical protein